MMHKHFINDPETHEYIPGRLYTVGAGTMLYDSGHLFEDPPNVNVVMYIKKHNEYFSIVLWNNLIGNVMTNHFLEEIRY
jgi:hypothetical protein